MCINILYVPKSKVERKKYCSMKCRNEGISITLKSINHRPPPPIKTSILRACSKCGKEFLARQSMIKKGFAIFCSKECFKDIFLQNSYKKQATVTLFKTDKNKYRNLHKKINKKFKNEPNLNTCEHCKKSGFKGKQIHWANISGKYKLIRQDWLRLCTRCHLKYDRPELFSR